MTDVREWAWLTDDERQMVSETLRAVTEGPYVESPRLELVADRDTVLEVRAAWPGAARDVEDTLHVVARALSAIQGGPWAPWHQYFEAGPLDLRDFRDRWYERHCESLASRDWFEVDRMLDSELAIIAAAVPRIVVHEVGVGETDWVLTMDVDAGGDPNFRLGLLYMP